MAKSLNMVQLIGNTGGAPDSKFTPSGRRVTTVSLATTRTWKGGDGAEVSDTQWHNLEFWGKLAEIVDQYVKKGDKIYVQGRLETDKWEKDGAKHSRTKIVGLELMMLGGRNGTPAEQISGSDEEVGNDAPASEDEFPF